MAKRRAPALVDMSRGRIDPEELDRFILTCQETERMCQQATAAGLDVGPEARKTADQLAVAVRMKKTYFPGRP